MEDSYIFDNTIYLAKHGSMAYGTNIPGSDVDEKGVCILPDPRYYFGFDRFEQKDKGWADGNDRVIYDIRKYFDLALTCNPNIIEILFVEEEDILKIDELGKQLRENRDMFLSQRAARTFVGYAISQLKRIEGHFKWLKNPPKKPTEKEFFKKTTLVGKYLYSIPFGEPVDHQVRDSFNIELDNHLFRVNQPRINSDGEDFIWAEIELEHFDKQAFKVANKRYNQYQQWIKNRNPKRAVLEKEFGFDCKHGMHLIRLLKMGLEIVRDGEVKVRRPDAAELLDIRNGKVSYPDLLKMAEELKASVNAALPKSPLPKEPDHNKAHNLLIRLTKTRLGNNNGLD